MTFLNFIPISFSLGFSYFLLLSQFLNRSTGKTFNGHLETSTILNYRNLDQKLLQDSDSLRYRPDVRGIGRKDVKFARVRSRNRKRTSWKSSSATQRSNSHNHLALYYTSSSPAILCSPRNCCLNFLHASSEQIKTQFENQRWTEYQYITVLLAWMTEQNKKKKQSTPNRRSWPRHTFLC